MDSAQHGDRAENNFMIIGSTVDGSGRITQDMVTDWLTRIQHTVSYDRSYQPASMNHVNVDSNVAEENDVVVEVQEFVPEEEITVVDSGEIVRSKASGKWLFSCLDAAVMVVVVNFVSSWVNNEMGDHFHI